MKLADTVEFTMNLNPKKGNLKKSSKFQKLIQKLRKHKNLNDHIHFNNALINATVVHEIYN